MNELHFHDHTLDGETAGFRRILVTEPQHPYVDDWWRPGHALGYEHAFTHQAVDLVQDVVQGRTPSPSFRDGLQVQQVLAAVERSSEERCWQDVPPGPDHCPAWGRSPEGIVPASRRSS
jgi:predicted dehydrogenase